MWLLIEHAKVHERVIRGEKTILIEIIFRFSKLKLTRKQPVVVKPDTTGLCLQQMYCPSEV